MNAKKIVVIAMPGCGNLGDDLISVCLTNQININYKDSSIYVLHGSISNPLDSLYPSSVKLLEVPTLREPKKYVSRQQKINNVLNDADLVVIGGGGLFQDTHSALNIHLWFKNIAKLKSNTSIIALGVGFGPFRFEFSKWYLRRVLPAFDFVQVRDIESEKLATDMGARTLISSDIVAGAAFIDGVEDYQGQSKLDSILGCSLRPGPWLEERAAVDMVKSLVRETFEEVYLFVFEHDRANPVELTFNQNVQAHLQSSGIKVRLFCYGECAQSEFWRAFYSVQFALAARFHANILWHRNGSNVLSLGYSPKVLSLYKDSDRQSIGETIKKLENLSTEKIKAQFSPPVAYKPYSLPKRVFKSEARQGRTTTNLTIRLVGLADMVAYLYKQLLRTPGRIVRKSQEKLNIL